LALLFAAVPVLLSAAVPAAAADIERGRYLFDAAGCLGCHTDKKNKGRALAGGRALKTPFGTFYSPNITPDNETGIGGWTDSDFVRALRHGLGPGGDNYFPVFPYASYTRISDADMLDLKAYLFSLPAVARANRPHDVKFPFRFRLLIGFWKALYFTPGPMPEDPARDAPWNRGAYLIEALGHCGECHTPRGFFGGPESNRHMAGTRQGPDGEIVPNITPDRETGIGKWSAADLQTVFSIGMLPDSDFVGGAMGEVVTNTTGRWSKPDLKAAVGYLRSLPAIVNKVKKDKPKTAGESWD